MTQDRHPRPAGAEKLFWSLGTISVTRQHFTDTVAFEYLGEVNEACTRGKIDVFRTSLKDGVIEARCAIREGYRGDEDGFGVESDEWIMALLRPDGSVLVPFALLDDPILQQARKRFADGVDD